jgi:hypothetical protein
MSTGRSGARQRRLRRRRPEPGRGARSGPAAASWVGLAGFPAAAEPAWPAWAEPAWPAWAEPAWPARAEPAWPAWAEPAWPAWAARLAWPSGPRLIRSAPGAPAAASFSRASSSSSGRGLETSLARMAASTVIFIPRICVLPASVSHAHANRPVCAGRTGCAGGMSRGGLAVEGRAAAGLRWRTGRGRLALAGRAADCWGRPARRLSSLSGTTARDPRTRRRTAPRARPAAPAGPARRRPARPAWCRPCRQHPATGPAGSHQPRPTSVHR